MDSFHQEACGIVNQLGCNYETACCFLHNAPDAPSYPIRGVGAPYYDPFLTHNISSSRTISFVKDAVQHIPETPKPPVVNYKPRTTNAPMDALKKSREESACKTTTINILNKQLQEVQREKAAKELLQEETIR